MRGSSGLLHETRERLADRVRADRVADLVREDTVARRRRDAEAEVQLELLRAVSLHQRHGVGVEVDHTSAAARLGCVDVLLAVDDGHRLVHGQLVPIEMDVGPSQAGDLAAAHPGQCQQPEQRLVAVAVDRGEERGELGRRPHLHLRSACPRRGHRRGVGEAGDVAHHQALALGVVEHLVEHRVDVMDARQRQALAEAAAGAQQLGVHRVEVGRAQLLQRDVAEAWQHVRADRRAVADERRRLATLVLETVEPRREELAQRHPARRHERARLVRGQQPGERGLRFLLRAERALRLAPSTALLPGRVGDPRRRPGGRLSAVDRAAGHDQTVSERYHGVTTGRLGENRPRPATPSTRTYTVPPAGFEPATHGLGNRCSIP